MPRRLLTSARCRGATSSRNPHPSLLSLSLSLSLTSGRRLDPGSFRPVPPRRLGSFTRYTSPLRNCPIRLVSLRPSVSLPLSALSTPSHSNSRCILHTCSCAYEGCLEQHASQTWSASFASACRSVSPVSTRTLIISRRFFMHTPLRALSQT